MTAAAIAAGGASRHRLLATCRAKAVDSPGGTFYLSCRTAGSVVGVGKTVANELLAELIATGFLDVVARGKPGPRARRATVYRLGPAASDVRPVSLEPHD
jgi:hypothetical protein